MDFYDLQIIEGLGIHGPRNITKVARELGLPEATLRRRLKKLLSKIFLRTNVYHTNIGLKKVIVLAKAFHGYENLLYKCLDAHDYLIYISRCFGYYDGSVAVFAVPAQKCPAFEQFLEHLENQGIAENIDHYWSTCFQTVNFKCNWYDKDAHEWNFFWKEWVQQVTVETTELPFTLIDPPEYPLKADETDIFILKELEGDATVTLKKLAENLHTSIPLVKYHFDEHVMQRKLLEDFQIIYYPFDKSTSSGLFFLLRFSDLEKMAKFAKSLLDKPFVLSLGKIFGKPSLFVYIYLPLAELRGFTDALGELIRMGYLQRYEYVFQDGEMTQRYSIPYKSFKNKSWMYEQEKYLKKVEAIMETEKPSTREKSAEYLTEKRLAPHI